MGFQCATKTQVSMEPRLRSIIANGVEAEKPRMRHRTSLRRGDVLNMRSSTPRPAHPPMYCAGLAGKMPAIPGDPCFRHELRT